MHNIPRLSILKVHAEQDFLSVTMLHSGEHLGQWSLLFYVHRTGSAWSGLQTFGKLAGQEEGGCQYDDHDDLEDHLNDGCHLDPVPMTQLELSFSTGDGWCGDSIGFLFSFCRPLFSVVNVTSFFHLFCPRNCAACRSEKRTSSSSHHTDLSLHPLPSAAPYLAGDSRVAGEDERRPLWSPLLRHLVLEQVRRQAVQLQYITNLPQKISIDQLPPPPGPPGV